ncbi:carboxypeptidase-like regulatory domain-containing protein [Hymenobacter sp. 5317J-9]|uniref:carboxypeptidase-like regulatory domain-containing protein n=1 Tax=Hymenobacter sp. 5317J-9 TaxID=2932250 RepID=UPI002468B847|nr:carboxypeptidase-like regulatory domain-containing protein [Hymenobacter sp. 5317J-9]
MNPDNVPNAENEPYDPNFEAQDEELASGGNNKLLYILGAVILALVVGYIALPKGGGSGLASVTPTFMLDDAAVTATAPTAADSIAAGLKADPAATTEEEKTTTEKPVAKATTAPKTVAVATAVPAAAPAAAAPAPVEAAPAPAPAAEPAAPAAPTTVTVSGKIENEIGKPLVGATVLLRGSSKGTSTDANGNYTLEVPAGTDNTLIFGYGGYDDEEVRSRGNQPVNVTLTPRAKSRRR